METTVAYAPKILSGVDVIDEAWGGLYRGGSYLVYGRAATGRGLLTMMFVQTGSMLEERCLFISPDRP
jgi:circadian clock protein KaiC